MVNINAYDEFGFILWYHVPVAYYHHLNGKLNSTNSKIGTKAVFYFSDNHNENELHNEIPFPSGRECYNGLAPNFTKEFWTPPPYKEFFKNKEFIFNKPILTIHNKNNTEWSGSGIFNYFPPKVLDQLFKEFKETHQIVYIRPPSDGNKYKYQKDVKQDIVDIGDEILLEMHPEVIWIGDLLKESDKTYNEIQFMLLANSDKHITPSGDAVIPSYFGGDVLIYNCASCMSANRGVWKTDSWLKDLSGSKIYGFNNYDALKEKAIELWK